MGSHGVSHKQKPTFDHTDRGEPVLGLILAIVGPVEGAKIVEHGPGRPESYAMIPPVPGGLGIVPLEIGVAHDRRIIRGKSTFAPPSPKTLTNP